MSRSTHRLPSLTALVTFECAARVRSFKLAAAELGVTPGAVSHQIKALEEELGQKLFLRQHRGVDLTPHGETLHSTLDRAFGEVAAALQQIRATAADASVTVGATTAVSALWLGPAILRFWRENSNIAVNQLVSDTRFSAVDAPEIYVCYGKDPRPDLVQSELYKDILVPVCAPMLAAELGALELSELARQRLIHLQADDRNWTSWQSWLQGLGYDGSPARGVSVNNYTIALAAAEEGAGIVLGWQRLIKPLLDRKTLTVLGNYTLPAPHGFYLVSLPDQRLSDNAVLLRDWLLAHLNTH